MKNIKFINIYLLFPVFIIASCKSQVQRVNDNIVLVDIGIVNRIGLAKEIEYIHSLNPKLIAIDIQFSKEIEAYQDSLLISTLRNCNNLVMSVIIDGYKGENVEYKSLTGSLKEFLGNSKIGFVNLKLEADEFRTLKSFSIFEKINGLTMYHFAIQTAMVYDSIKTMMYIKDKPRIVNVSYSDDKKFKVFTDYHTLNRLLSTRDIEGKIVLIGGLGPGNEDKFFTPLNKKIKPYEPDMYGLEYLANIVAQVLESK